MSECFHPPNKVFRAVVGFRVIGFGVCWVLEGEVMGS